MMNINLKDCVFYKLFHTDMNADIFINRPIKHTKMLADRYDEKKRFRYLTINLDGSYCQTITLPPLSVKSLDFANSLYHTICIEGVWPTDIKYLTIGNCDWRILIDNPGLPNGTITNLKIPPTLKRVTIKEHYSYPLKMNAWLHYILENTEIEVQFNQHSLCYFDESMKQIEKDIMIKKKVFYYLVFKKVLTKELIKKISEYLDYKRFIRPKSRLRGFSRPTQGFVIIDEAAFVDESLFNRINI